MSPSPLLPTGRAARATLAAAAVLLVAALIGLTILDGRQPRNDRADAAAPSASPSTTTPPASTKKTPPDLRTSKPIRLSDGSVQLDGNVLIPASQASANEIDVRVSSPPFARPWTGPWPLDVSQLRIDHTPTHVVVTLSFADLNIPDGWRRNAFWVYVDSMGSPAVPRQSLSAADQEVDFTVDSRLVDGAVYRHRGDPYLPPIRDCKFDASLHEGRDAVTVKAPRRCFDYPTRLRARAQLHVNFYNGWEGVDSTDWTGFAALGGSAATRDPALPWREPVVN